MRFFLMLLTFLYLSAHPVEAQELSELPLVDQLRVALLQEDTGKIKALVQAGADLNLANSDGGPLIVIAAVASSPAMLEFLVSHGANPNSQDIHGYSAVMKALEFGRVDNAKKLKALGASLKGISNDGYTVRLLAENVGLDNFGPAYSTKFEFKISSEEANQILLYAAEAGDLETVKFALDNGASVHAKANNGWTAAMLAGLGGHPIVLKHLVLNGALEFNGIYHAAEDVDLITAILVGEGGANRDNGQAVKDMLYMVISSKANVLANRGTKYRAIAEKLKYPLFVLDLFPQYYTRLPPPESQIPVDIPSTRENWKKVQQILTTEKLYNGKIDGKPGPQTYRALYAYYLPLQKVIRQNAINAAKAARKDKLVQVGTGGIGVKCYYVQIEKIPRKRKLCGEYTTTSGQNSQRQFSGYYSFDFFYDFENGSSYQYATEGPLFSGFYYPFPSFLLNEWHNRGKGDYHTIFVAKVLDKVFSISTYIDRTVYGIKDFDRENNNISSPPRQRKKMITLKGNFPEPIKPYIR